MHYNVCQVVNNNLFLRQYNYTDVIYAMTFEHRQ